MTLLIDAMALKLGAPAGGVDMRAFGHVTHTHLLSDIHRVSITKTLSTQGMIIQIAVKAGVIVVVGSACKGCPLSTQVVIVAETIQANDRIAKLKPFEGRNGSR